MKLRRLAECHPEKRHWAKGLCHRCYYIHHQPAANLERWVNAYAADVERREAAIEEDRRLEAWLRWPSPALRFLAPIGEAPWDHHGHETNPDNQHAARHIERLRGKRRPKAGELLDPMWAG